MTAQFLPYGAFCLPERRVRSSQGRLFGDVAIILFLSAQILDGAFTYLGLRIFGTGIEANPLIAWLIAQLGPAAALASAKVAAIGAGAFLHLWAVHGAVAALTGLYFLLAIGPWTHLLFYF